MSDTQNTFGQYFPELLEESSDGSVKFKVDGIEYDGVISDHIFIIIPKLPKKYFDIVKRKRGDELSFSEFLQIFEGYDEETADTLTAFLMKNKPEYTLTDIDDLHSALMSKEGEESLDLLKNNFHLSDNTIADYKIGYENKSNRIIFPVINFTKSGVVFVIKLDTTLEYTTFPIDLINFDYLFGYHQLLTSEYDKEPIFVTEDIVDALFLRQIGYLAIALLGGLNLHLLNMIKSKTLIIYSKRMVTSQNWGFGDMIASPVSGLNLIDIKRDYLQEAVTKDQLDKDKIEILLENKKWINRKLHQTYSHLNDFESTQQVPKIEFPQFFYKGEQYYGLISKSYYQIISSSRQLQTIDQFVEKYKTNCEISQDIKVNFSSSGISKYAIDDYIPNSDFAFNKIENKLKEYIYFPNSETYKFVSVWIIGTYLFNNFNYFPYMHIQAPKGSGKSVLLDLLSHLCFNAKYYINPTPAVVFRDINDSLSTILFDEVEDFISNNVQRELLTLLNQGFAKKATLPRVKGDSIIQYNIFSPKAFAGINQLNDVLLSRSIKVKIEKKPPSKILNRFIIDTRLQNIFVDIRNEIYIFGLYFAKEIMTEYKNAHNSEELKDVTNRELDNWAPLFSIVKLVEKDMTSKTLLTDLKNYIEIDRSLKSIGDDSTESDVAYFLMEYFRNTKSLSILSQIEKAYEPKELFEAIKQAKVITPFNTINKLTSYLSLHFGMKSKSIKVKVDDGIAKNKRCYVIILDEIMDKLKSYNPDFSKDEFYKNKNTSDE